MKTKIFFFFFLFFILPGCRDNPADAPGRDNVLRFDVAAPFTSLNPADVQVSGSSVIFPLLYSYLFVPDEKGILQPDLARKWTYDSDTLTWTITLRTDARFHNGMPVTAEDVNYSLETILQNLRPSLFESIDAVLAVSDDLIELRLKKDDPDFPKKIWDMEILCHPDKGNAGNEIPVGSGPFRFSSRDGERKVVLTANPSYYQGRPSLDGVIYYYKPDKEKSWARLLSGETDIAQEISPKNHDIIQDYQDAFYFDHYILKFYSILLYNTRDPLFSSPSVRRALTQAIDRQYIVDNILYGYGKIAVSPMGVDSPFHNPQVLPLPYDPQKSLTLLESEGWTYDETDLCLLKKGRKFEFTLLVPEEYQVEKLMARYIKICLADIGVKLKIKILPLRDLYFAYHNDDFQAALCELPGVYKRPEYATIFWIPDNSQKSPAGRLSDTGLVELLNKAVHERIPARQKEIFFQADAAFAELQPGSFLFHKTAFDVLSRRFVLPCTFSLNHEGIYRLRYSALKK